MSDGSVSVSVSVSMERKRSNERTNEPDGWEKGRVSAD